MTLVPPARSDDGRADHPGELRLRRHRIGELGGVDAQTVDQHLADCADCRTRLGALDDEQRAFAAQIPFDRFAGGVERAARVPRARPVSRRTLVAGSGLALAAAAALVLVIRPGGDGDPAGGNRGNRLKGGEFEARLQIALAAGGQRALDPGGRAGLRAGDQLRLGYRAASPGHLVVVSVDDAGAVSTRYPDQGDTLPVAAARALAYLPGSITLTGAGKDRIYMITGAQAFGVEAAVREVGAAHTRAGGDLGAMGPLQFRPGVAVTSFTWLLDKP
jgi:hypothetical protein